MDEEVRRLRSANRHLQNSNGDVKHSVGKRVAKELLRMTNGYKQNYGDCEGIWGAEWRGATGKKSGQL